MAEAALPPIVRSVPFTFRSIYITNKTSPDISEKKVDLILCLQPSAKLGCRMRRQRHARVSHLDCFRFFNHQIICSESVCIFPWGAVAAFTRHYGATGPEACRAHVAPAALVKLQQVGRWNLTSPGLSRPENSPMLLQKNAPLTFSPQHPTLLLLSSPPAPLHLRRQTVSGSEVLMQLLSGETPLCMSSTIFYPDINWLFLSLFRLTPSLPGRY